MTPPPTALDAWLAAATRGLCEDAKARIAEEIATHYEEAFTEACDAGLSETDADARAVGSLGSPRKARRRLRREHLTRWEAKRVNTFVTAHKAYLRRWGLDRIEYLRRLSWSFGALAILAVAWALKAAEFSDGDSNVSNNSPLAFGLSALLIAGLIGLVFLMRWFAGRLSHRLYPDGCMPIWNVFLVHALNYAALSIFFAFNTALLLTSNYGLLKGSFANWNGFQWVFACAVGVMVPMALVESARFYKLARKLQRLGYNQPPEAMV